MREKTKSNYVVSAMLWIAVSAFAVPLASAAQSVEGWYAGGSLGQCRGTTSDGDVVTGLAARGITGTSSDNQTGGKIFVGYQLNENFALEGGYFNLVTYSANGTVTAVRGVPAASTFGISTKVQGGNFDLVGMLPFG